MRVPISFFGCVYVNFSLIRTRELVLFGTSNVENAYV